jgi:prophage antirepressor-like protein
LYKNEIRDACGCKDVRKTFKTSCVSLALTSHKTLSDNAGTTQELALVSYLLCLKARRRAGSAFHRTVTHTVLESDLPLTG